MESPRRRRPQTYVKPPRSLLCAWCGSLFDVPPSISRQLYCPDCRAEARRRALAAAAERRVPTPARIAGWQEYRVDKQHETAAIATAAGRRFDAVDDAVIVALGDRPVEVTAKLLNRTYNAIVSRRKVLRRRGKM